MVDHPTANMGKEDALPCADKIAFDTRRQAEAAATVAGYQHGARVKAYRCRRCSLWHLASDYSSS